MLVTVCITLTIRPTTKLTARAGASRNQQGRGSKKVPRAISWTSGIVMVSPLFLPSPNIPGEAGGEGVNHVRNP